jgi:hypothetical protein
MAALVSNFAIDERKLADIRFIGDLLGTYVLLSDANTEGRLQVFTCRARSISAREAVVNAPVAGAVGDPLTVNFEGLGVLQGQIARVMAGGFVIKINCSDEDAVQLAIKIEWMKRRKLKTVSERREFKRVLPRETRAMLIMGGGQKMTCMLVDMSQSGVAVSAAVTPRIGTLMAVGAIPGHVARHFEGGFAIHFAELQKLEQVEGLLTLRTGENRVLAAQAIADSAQKTPG